MMKRIGAWMLLALFTLVGEWHGRCYGCLEEERIGLLEIQSLINPHGVSWTDHWVDTNSNCCEWRGIECDNTTRRVIQLSSWSKGFPQLSCGQISRLCTKISGTQRFTYLIF